MPPFVQLLIGMVLVGYGVYLIFSKKKKDFILSTACIIAGGGLAVYAVPDLFS